MSWPLFEKAILHAGQGKFFGLNFLTFCLVGKRLWMSISGLTVALVAISPASGSEKAALSLAGELLPLRLPIIDSMEKSVSGACLLQLV